MNNRKIFALMLVMFSLLGCAQPVPPEKSAYVGEWKEQTMYLRIDQDGMVQYERKNGNQTTKINAPIKKFEGNNFEVGIGPASTKFIVSNPPYQDGTAWKMVVDGIELTRSAQ